jgi:Fe2+ or Zn2+ uptake regulation protein
MTVERRHSEFENPALQEIFSRVRASMPRLTKGKKAVICALFHAGRPMTVYEIYDEVRRDSPVEQIDLVTIYRNVEQFEKSRIIVKTEHSHGGWRYALAGQAHSHSIQCLDCGVEIVMGECFMAEVERLVSTRTGFQNIRHIVNFTGFCPKCASGDAVGEK